MRWRTISDSIGRARALPGLCALVLVLAGCSAQPQPVAQPAAQASPTAEAAVPPPTEAATPEVAGVSRAAPTETPDATPTAPPPTTSAPPETQPTPVPAAAGFPDIDMDSYTVRPDEPVGLRGEGFQPGEQVRIYLATAPRDTLAEARADARGGFTVSDLLIPGSDSGTRTLVVEGTSSGLRVERTVGAVAYSPWVRLDRYAVRPGETIGFAGYDFAPGEPVRVYLDNDRENLLAEVKANDRGEVFAQSVVTPGPRDVGIHELTFSSGASRSNLSVQYEVLGYVPIVELTSYAGRPGALVSLNGRGFAPGEAVRVYMGEGERRTEVSGFQADARGEFSRAGEFRVPADAQPGPLPVTAEGELSRRPATQTFGVEALAPWVGLSSYRGPVGTEVTIHAEGFGADESVDVYLNGGQERVASGQTDTLGAAHIGPVTIPPDGGRSVTFVLKGALSGSQAEAAFDVE